MFLTLTLAFLFQQAFLQRAGVQQANATPTPAEVIVQQLTAAETTRNSKAVAASLLALTDLIPTADFATLALAIGPIAQAVDDPDPQTRVLAMLALVASTNRPGPDSLLPAIEPHLHVIGLHLADEDPAVQQVAILVLGGFVAHPVPAAIDPLIAFLDRPGPPAASSLGAVYALLTLGVDAPVHPEIASAILRFILRPDLPASLRPRVFDAIANYTFHSETLDTGLLSFLAAAQSPLVRSTLIAGLPKLRLTQAVVEATRARLTGIVADSSENSTVKAQAAAILPCWHSPRMTDPCPAIPVRYRIIPPPAPVRAPRYESPPITQ